MVHFTWKVVAFIFILRLGESYVESTDTDESIKGATLVDFGTERNSELLKIIGYAVINLECSNMRCSPWSAWTTCDKIIDTFGGNSRKRTCEIGHKNCKGYKNEVEEQVEICEVTK